LELVVRNEPLYDLCKQALISGLDHLDELISKGERFKQALKLKPIIEKDGLKGLESTFDLDKVEILVTHMNEILNLPQVKKLYEFLDILVKDENSKIKVRKTTSDYLNTLFYTYANTKTFPTYNQKEFNQSYLVLEDYIYGTLQYHSFVPLYNFQMTTSRIRIDSDFVIRKIKADEYVMVAKQTSHEVYYLRYAIEFNSTIFEYNEKSGPKLCRTITFLRLYKQGAVSYSEVYDTPAIGMALGVSIKSKPRSLQHFPEYHLNQNDIKKLRRFYSDFYEIYDRIKEGSFFYIAIDRFNSALEENEFADKIIDLSIALEALFSTSSEDLTYKLRIRVSVLLGIDYDPYFIYQFIGKAYGIRSKLVHGKLEKKATDSVFVVDSKEYKLCNVANELEQITRLSIRRMLYLFKHHNYKQENEFLNNVIDKVAIGHPRTILGPQKI
jgi:hypothetical protein